MLEVDFYELPLPFSNKSTLGIWDGVLDSENKAWAT
jgi:hypothetical protein